MLDMFIYSFLVDLQRIVLWLFFYHRYYSLISRVNSILDRHICIVFWYQVEVRKHDPIALLNKCFTQVDTGLIKQVKTKVKLAKRYHNEQQHCITFLRLYASFHITHAKSNTTTQHFTTTNDLSGLYSMRYVCIIS